MKQLLHFNFKTKLTFNFSIFVCLCKWDAWCDRVSFKIRTAIFIGQRSVLITISMRMNWSQYYPDHWYDQKLIMQDADGIFVSRRAPITIGTIAPRTWSCVVGPIECGTVVYKIPYRRARAWPVHARANVYCIQGERHFRSTVRAYFLMTHIVLKRSHK